MLLQVYKSRCQLYFRPNVILQTAENPSEHILVSLQNAENPSAQPFVSLQNYVPTSPRPFVVLQTHEKLSVRPFVKLQKHESDPDITLCKFTKTRCKVDLLP